MYIVIIRSTTGEHAIVEFGKILCMLFNFKYNIRKFKLHFKYLNQSRCNY